MTDVHFIPLTPGEDPSRIQKAVLKLFRATEFTERIEKGDLIAVKIHFGEEGNTGHIPPRHAAVVAREIIRARGKPFFTDTNTLYVGRRANAVDHLMLAHEHGFRPEVLGAPVLIADGLVGNAEASIPINGKHFKDVPIARELAFARGLVSLNHFTGHMVTQFGACIKNLGMGGASRAGKLLQHAKVRPHVNVRKCIACEECLRWCTTGSLSIVEGKALILPSTCIGCGQCLSVCPHHAIQFNWSESADQVQEKMAEHALGVIRAVKGKAIHLTFLTRITAECDCLAKDEPAILPDIGLAASEDPVALDRACLDLVEERLGKSLGNATGREHLPINQLDYAEALGLGSQGYTLKTLDL